MAIYRVSRRQFLRDAGVGAGALILGCAIPESAEAWTLFHKQFPLNNFVSIELDGTVHIWAHRSEMGQGTRSSLAAVLVDEMDVSWDKVKIDQADADAVLFGVPFPVTVGAKTPQLVKGEDAQFVDSSRSMAAYYLPMRYFGAGIRLVMLKAAALRWKLIKADAAFKWGADAGVSKLQAREGRVYNGSNSVSYQHLLVHAALLSSKFGLPSQYDIDPFLKKKEEWKYIGTKNMPFVDCVDMVTGKAEYGADIDKPGMLIAMIERCPVANGLVASYDDSETKKVPGVKYVTRVLPEAFVAAVGAGGVGGGFIPHDGVAVIAENTWAAWEGRRKLKVEWNIANSQGAYNAKYDTDTFRKDLENATRYPPSGTAKAVRRKGNVDAAFASAAPGDIHEASYWIPHLAQTPMEPPAALAIWDGGKFEVWSPTQGPELTQHYLGVYLLLNPNPVEWLIWQAEEVDQNVLKVCERPNQDTFNKALAAQLQISEEELLRRKDAMKEAVRDKVKVHVTLLGGGFGRKSNPDYAIEAAFLAKQYPGTPIRVQWTREDDVRFSFYNSAAGLYYKAALGADNRPTAFLERSAFTSFFATLFPIPPLSPPAFRDIFVKARTGFHNGGEYPYGSAIERSQGLEDMPFHIDNVLIENCPAENHVRCGWMRSVANIYHAFGTCSFADELARKAGEDPKDYLLKLIGAGYFMNGAALKAEGVDCLDNNQFPVDPILLQVNTPPAPPYAQILPVGMPPNLEILPQFGPDTRRLRAVVERVAAESGWKDKVNRYKGTRRGVGIAAHRSFLSYNAVVIDVSLSEDNEITINDIWSVLDCGMAVNVDRVLAQIEGGVNYGLSIALLGEITLKDGKVVQHNFDDYPVLRIHHAPKTIHAFIHDPGPEIRKDYKNGEVPPTGVGEPPTPAVAPALANAICAAGGPRIREIPFCKTIVVH